MKKVVDVFLVVAAAGMLFLAQSARWINTSVFNQENFTNSVLTALQTESSRTAIATTVVNKTLAHRPLIRQYAGERLVAVTAGLLDSDVSTQAMRYLSNNLYAYATTSNRKDVTINLVAIKQPLNQIIELARNPDTADKLGDISQQIPDEVTLIRSDEFPDLSGTVRVMLWLGPVFWLGTFTLFSLYIYRGRREYARRVYIVSAAITVAALIGILTYPFVPPSVMAAIPTTEIRPLAENLSKQFLAPFRAQMVQMFVVAAVATLLFSQRYNLQRLLKKLASKLPDGG